MTTDPIKGINEQRFAMFLYFNSSLLLPLNLSTFFVPLDIFDVLFISVDLFICFSQSFDLSIF